MFMYLSAYAESGDKLRTFTQQVGAKVVESLAKEGVVNIKTTTQNFRWIDTKGYSLSYENTNTILFVSKDQTSLEGYKKTIVNLLKSSFKDLKFQTNIKNSVSKNSIGHLGVQRGSVRCIIEVPSLNRSMLG